MRAARLSARHRVDTEKHPQAGFVQVYGSATGRQWLTQIDWLCGPRGSRGTRARPAVAAGVPGSQPQEPRRQKKRVVGLS